MVLRPYSEHDIWLTEALECDAAVMKDLGGPTPKEKIPQIHARRLAGVEAKKFWYFVIEPNAGEKPVGTIGIWQSEWKAEKICEMGWMILPAFQGRGIATAAGRLILERARAEQKYSEIRAFPAATNGASNAICRKLGFTLHGEIQAGYNDPTKISNDWRIVLSQV